MGKRRASRQRIEAQIVELGRRHLVEHGVAGLSLRAIARELGMVSSAVYRYVASRDELLTLLLVDAYDDLADAVEAARDAMAEVWSDDVLAIAHAVRRWALTHPPGGRCCMAARCLAIKRRRSGRSDRVPECWACCSTLLPPGSRPATSC
ncbi:bacterial regulatory s, tetR family protein [Mycobacterium xenopi 3993]|nr:bacterial regulatory s, tetR family protein [Mycobacterium xenopi 3993]